MIKKAILFLFLSVMITSPTMASRGTQNHTKLWINADIIGPLSTIHPNLKYYIEPRLQWIDDPYRFEETYVYIGPGYQFTPNFIAIVGIAYDLSKNLHGVTAHEDRLFQQANWRLFENAKYDLDSRTRFEERKNLAQPQLSIRLRQRFSLRTQIAQWQGHSVILTDEVFLNLNHPKWINTPTFDQNRMFIGLGTRISEHTIWDIGYMGQYLYTTPKQYNNILYTSFNVRM